MVYDSCHTCEQPFMWTVIDVVYVVVCLADEVGPSFRYDGSHTDEPHGIKNCSQHLSRILKDDASKADVYGWRSCSQEFREARLRLVRRCVTEEESTHILRFVLAHVRRKSVQCTYQYTQASR